MKPSEHMLVYSQTRPWIRSLFPDLRRSDELLLQHDSYINIRSQPKRKTGARPVHINTANAFSESRYLSNFVRHTPNIYMYLLPYLSTEQMQFEMVKIRKYLRMLLKTPAGNSIVFQTVSY